MKVVLNKRWGGYSLSEKAVARLEELGVEDAHRYSFDYDRSNPLLIQVVEELEDEADGQSASLVIVEIPFEDSSGWYIHNYDGRETIHENHRSW